MTDRSVSLLAKYSDDLSQKCNQTAYEAPEMAVAVTPCDLIHCDVQARTAERKASKAELKKSKVRKKDRGFEDWSSHIRNYKDNLQVRPRPFRAAVLA